MLVIRLQRTGRKNTPAYRIVVAEKEAAVKGKSLEVVGHFLPTREPVTLEYKEERIRHWVKHGAHVSDTVARLLSKKGLAGLDRFFERYSHKRSRTEEPEAPAAPAAAAAATAPVEAAPAAPESGDKPAEQA